VHSINLKYLSFLGVLVVLYLALLYFMPQKFDWTVTYYHHDKNPFGAYVFKSLSDKSWTGAVATSNETLFEMQEMEATNLMVLCDNFRISDMDIEALLHLADTGKTILIAAGRIDTLLLNHLGVTMNEWNLKFIVQSMWGGDSIGIKLTGPVGFDNHTYWLPNQLLAQYFVDFDRENTEVLAENSNGKPVLLKMSYGDGTMILSSTPMVFTNFSMLKEDNHQFVAGILSTLPEGSLHWSEYYQLGRLEAQTPLRYILSEPSLKWAFYITVSGIILFMIFKSKRTQRVIPVIAPLKNDTLVFVKTIARLYYLKKDHKQLAAKKILHFVDHLKQKLLIDVNDEVGEVISRVAAKTGSSEEDVRAVMDMINKISASKYISSDDLRTFVTKADDLLKENLKT
jgi:hypothetical protein